MNEDTYFDGTGTWFTSYGGAVSMAMLATMLSAPQAVGAEFIEFGSIYILPHTASSTLSGLVEFEQAEKIEPYQPRTALGRKLVELRQKAIADGMELWDADTIAHEVRERRGES